MWNLSSYWHTAECRSLGQCLAQPRCLKPALAPPRAHLPILSESGTILVLFPNSSFCTLMPDGEVLRAFIRFRYYIVSSSYVSADAKGVIEQHILSSFLIIRAATYFFLFGRSLFGSHPDYNLALRPAGPELLVCSMYIVECKKFVHDRLHFAVRDKFA